MSDFDETLNEEELNIITLTDEDGTDKDFEFLDLIEFKKNLEPVGILLIASSY